MSPDHGRQLPGSCETPSVHPALAIRRSAAKGRLVVAASVIEPLFCLCSRDRCCQRIPPSEQATVTCPRQCCPELVWCSHDCRAQDARRHEPECAWLRSGGRQHCDESRADGNETTGTAADDASHFDRRGWDAVWHLAGPPESFPARDVRSWRDLAANFLVGQIPGVSCTVES
ncbi:hypothetical protein MN608_09173 [Microdochium nivale]|nr:hypothetical protein MN608_09173 [Microdochium nivale]